MQSTKGQSHFNSNQGSGLFYSSTPKEETKTAAAAVVREGSRGYDFGTVNKFDLGDSGLEENIGGSSLKKASRYDEDFKMIGDDSELDENLLRDLD